MRRAVTAGGVAVWIALAFAAEAEAQRGGQRGYGGGGGMRVPGMPGRQACQRGMTHEACMYRCIELGGTGRGPPNPMCSHRCNNMGCKPAVRDKHAIH